MHLCLLYVYAQGRFQQSWVCWCSWNFSISVKTDWPVIISRILILSKLYQHDHEFVPLLSVWELIQLFAIAGSIPIQLGNLKNLNSLYLHKNKLRGEHHQVWWIRFFFLECASVHDSGRARTNVFIFTCPLFVHAIPAQESYRCSLAAGELKLIGRSV